MYIYHCYYFLGKRTFTEDDTVMFKQPVRVICMYELN